jgi:hypothetical protein
MAELALAIRSRILGHGRLDTTNSEEHLGASL